MCSAQAPVNLQVDSVLSNSAIVSWDNGSCGQNNFILSFKEISLSSWDSIVVTNSGVVNQIQNILSLNSQTTYNWRVKCDSNWFNGPNFTTISCFTFNFNVTNASCNGNSDGAIDPLLTGGFPPYTYSWSSTTHPSFSETTEDIDTLFPGIYYLNVTDSAGCTELDSVVVASNNNSDTTNTSVTSCDSYNWNGVFYDSTGIYDSLFVNQSGCDSLAILNLTINNSDTTNTSVTSCDSYNWNGVFYDSTGIYIDTLLSLNGCDSIVTIDLTILNSTSSFEVITSCDSYTWNGITYYSNGVYDSLFINFQGCDSLAMLILTLDSSDTSTVQITSCNDFTWLGITSVSYTHLTLPTMFEV